MVRIAIRYTGSGEEKVTGVAEAAAGSRSSSSSNHSSSSGIDYTWFLTNVMNN